MGLTSRQARHFYDWFGRAQDLQAFYEDRATGDLLAHGRFDEARAVVEFGCGTGRLAAHLLDRQLPADARYLGADLSTTMTSLARTRLRRFGHRAAIIQADGTQPLPVATGTFDRFLAVYVLDLLGPSEAQAMVAEAAAAAARRPAGNRQPGARHNHTYPAGVPRLDSSVVPGPRPHRRLPAHHRVAAAGRLAHRAPRAGQRVGPHLRDRDRQQMKAPRRGPGAGGGKPCWALRDLPWVSPDPGQALTLTAAGRTHQPPAPAAGKRYPAATARSPISPSPHRGTHHPAAAIQQPRIPRRMPAASRTGPASRPWTAGLGALRGGIVRRPARIGDCRPGRR